MAGEKNSQDYLAEVLADNEPAGGKASGRIFAGAEEGEPKINLDAEIEKNIKIRTMPRKFKISTAGTDKKTTVVGAIIMIVGVLVLAAAIYLAYIFLINPQGKTPAPAPQNNPPAKVETPAATPPAPVTPAPPAPVTPTPVTPAPPTPVTPEPAASSTPPAATSTPPAPAAAVKGAPTGAKAASDISVAEKSLFGADPAKTDSDGDGFSDISETLNLYNPAGAGKITDNPHIGVYQDAPNKYSVDYPKIWKVQNLENGDTLIFTAADNSLIEIISEPNAGKQKLLAWYNAQFPDAPITDAEITSRDGWQGAFQADKQIFYLADLAGNRIYTISYVPAANNDLSYYNIFLMMINSFTVK